MNTEKIKTHLIVIGFILACVSFVSTIYVSVSIYNKIESIEMKIKEKKEDLRKEIRDFVSEYNMKDFYENEKIRKGLNRIFEKYQEKDE